MIRPCWLICTSKPPSHQNEVKIACNYHKCLHACWSLIFPGKGWELKHVNQPGGHRTGPSGQKMGMCFTKVVYRNVHGKTCNNKYLFTCVRAYLSIHPSIDHQSIRLSTNLFINLRLMHFNVKALFLQRLVINVTATHASIHTISILYLYLYTYTSLSISYLFIHFHLYLYIHLYLYLYIELYLYIFIHLYLYLSLSIFKCIYIYVDLCL